MDNKLLINDKHAYFGLYPQSVKEENVTIVREMSFNGKVRYIGDDEKVYIRLLAKPYKSKTLFQIDDDSFKDIYYFNNNELIEEKEYFFKLEPIEWDIIFCNDNKLLLYSSLIIDVIKYDSYSSEYKSSEINKFLNSEFIYEHFKPDEIESLIDTNNGKAFLLSADEIKTFYPEGVPKKNITDYAKAKGAHISKINNKGFYYLRAPLNGNSVDIVYPNGFINKTKFNKEDVGLSPAIEINLNK